MCQNELTESFAELTELPQNSVCLFRNSTLKQYIFCPFLGFSHGTSSPHLGEECAGSEKLGLAPKVLHSLWGSAELFFNWLFAVKPSAELPCMQTPKLPQHSAEDPESLNIRVARLQNKVGTKVFFQGTNFLMKNAPKLSPKFLSLDFVAPKRIPQNSHQISCQISLPKIKKKNSPTSFCRSAGRIKYKKKV